MISETPITFELDRKITNRVSSSSNDSGDLMLESYVQMLENSQRLELKMNQWKSMAKDLSEEVDSNTDCYVDCPCQGDEYHARPKRLMLAYQKLVNEK